MSGQVELIKKKMKGIGDCDSEKESTSKWVAK